MDVGSEPNGKKQSEKSANFIFTHAGRTVDWDQTPDEAGIENNDVIMAVELMDLTQAEAVRPCVSSRSFFALSVFLIDLLYRQTALQLNLVLRSTFQKTRLMRIVRSKSF
jgi:hypothetical protein